MPRSMPDLVHEDALGGLIAGVDEAGRGPLAGPVCAAAVILDRGMIPVGLNDSKMLSATKRNILFDLIQAQAHVAIGWTSVEEIDALNISEA